MLICSQKEAGMMFFYSAILDQIFNQMLKMITFGGLYKLWFKTNLGHQLSNCRFLCEQLWLGNGPFGCLGRENTGSAVLKPLTPPFPVPLSLYSGCLKHNWGEWRQVGQETGVLYQSKYTLILGAVWLEAWIGLLTLMASLHRASGIDCPA